MWHDYAIHRGCSFEIGLEVERVEPELVFVLVPELFLVLGVVLVCRF